MEDLNIGKVALSLSQRLEALTKQIPIIFVAHSMGGLVTKKVGDLALLGFNSLTFAGLYPWSE
jgi:surfactin synthase thioesterase subunit